MVTFPRICLACSMTFSIIINSGSIFALFCSVFLSPAGRNDISIDTKINLFCTESCFPNLLNASFDIDELYTQHYLTKYETSECFRNCTYIERSFCKYGTQKLEICCHNLTDSEIKFNSDKNFATLFVCAGLVLVMIILMHNAAVLSIVISSLKCANDIETINVETIGIGTIDVGTIDTGTIDVEKIDVEKIDIGTIQIMVLPTLCYYMVAIPTFYCSIFCTEVIVLCTLLVILSRLAIFHTFAFSQQI